MCVEGNIMFKSLQFLANNNNNNNNNKHLGCV